MGNEHTGPELALREGLDPTVRVHFLSLAEISCCGRPVPQEDREALERPGACILRPSFAGTRLRYDSDAGQIRYQTGKEVIRSMDALDWIALVTSHLPNPHEQIVRYYGCYSNASRGKRRRRAVSVVPAESEGAAPSASAAEEFVGERRRSWAQLLKKLYEVDPLTCPRCAGRMQIIAFVHDRALIRKILQHLRLWELPPRAPPRRLFPHKPEAFPASLTPQQAQRVRASTDALFWDDLPILEGGRARAPFSPH